MPCAAFSHPPAAQGGDTKEPIQE